jgi:hypothetical protein
MTAPDGGAEGALPPCCVCGTRGGRRRRRGACITCAKKFAAAMVAIPGAIATPPGPRPQDPLHQWVDRLTREQRLRVHAYLHEQMAEEEV